MARSSRYKDFLQAALQRRFIQTMGFLLVDCYLQALVLGNWPPLSFWWFRTWPSSTSQWQPRPLHWPKSNKDGVTASL